MLNARRGEYLWSRYVYTKVGRPKRNRIIACVLMVCLRPSEASCLQRLPGDLVEELCESLQLVYLSIFHAFHDVIYTDRTTDL